MWSHTDVFRNEVEMFSVYPFIPAFFIVCIWLSFIKFPRAVQGQCGFCDCTKGFHCSHLCFSIDSWAIRHTQYTTGSTRDIFCASYVSRGIICCATSDESGKLIWIPSCVHAMLTFNEDNISLSIRLIGVLSENNSGATIIFPPINIRATYRVQALWELLPG